MKLALEGDRATCLKKAATLERLGLLGIGTERARRAGGAVLRRLEVAQQVVVLELCRDEEERIERQRQRVEALESAVRPAAARHISILRRRKRIRYFRSSALEYEYRVRPGQPTNWSLIRVSDARP